MRTAEEITMRCKLILNQSDIVLLVEKSSSPTATYDMVMDATGNDETAKAARWLGVLRRDYSEPVKGVRSLFLPYPYVVYFFTYMSSHLLERVRLSIRCGQPFGSVSWQEKTVKRFGLESTLRLRGRPKKGS